MSTDENQALFTPFALGDRQLRNRVVMAPMTRGRARNAGLIPTDLHVKYYRQRASAGLILTEATWVSRDGIGFINVPGLFTPEQVESWRSVTEAVHAEGGTIFAQFAHSGAVSHPLARGALWISRPGPLPAFNRRAADQMPGANAQRSPR